MADEKTRAPAMIAARPGPEPKSARGKRTRAALIGAAREVFERDGFLDARIADIAGAAGVAIGSFYTHFESREEIFAAVLAELQEEMLHPSPQYGGDHPSTLALLESNNRAYLLAYRRNAKLNALMEQVAAVDPEFMKLRQERSEAFIRRNASFIRRLQRDGLADPELDADLAAGGLSQMVSRMANRAFVQGRSVPFEKLVGTTTRLWANALRIPTEEE